MKTRNGFVSNSSSSNFIVAFPKEDYTAQKIKHLLFGFETEFKYYDDAFSTDEMAQKIFKDIEAQKDRRNDLGHLLDIVAYGGLCNNDFQEMETEYKMHLTDEQRNLIDKEARETNSKRAMIYLLKFLEKNKEEKIYTFSFSDNGTSFEAALEHGEVFGKIKYIQVSCH